MADFDRRDFLKISAITAASAALPKAVNALASDSSSSNASVWSTSSSGQYVKREPLAWSRTAAGEGTVIIDPAQRFQTVLGFGAAFTDAACFTLNRLDPAARKDLFHDLFHPSQMDLSVSRICIGASDYSASLFSYDDGTEPDPELKRFSIEHDRAYILPILREARAVNPDLWLLASPWSPPGWMKFNNSMLGGCMRQSWFGSYAGYFDKFLNAYAAEGVRINSVTVQNEVDTDQDGRMPACAWPQEYEIGFVRDHLGPTLAKSQNPADIWVLDHNYNLWGRALGELEDEGARQYIKGIAWHGYVGSPEAMTRVQNAYPNIGMYWTEGGPDFETPGYETEWSKWATTFTDILRNRARCIIAWNYALDEHGKPNIGPFNCAGLVTVDSKSRAITRSGQYWAFKHFSSHIRRGAQIIASTANIDGLHHVVARNPTGEFVAVLTNSAPQAKTVTLKVGDASASVQLAADSITTVSWT